MKHWRDHHGDRIRRLYWWHTTHWGNLSQNYAAPVWSTNASDSSFKKIQTAQNAALRTATGAHKMSSIDHLHQESLTLRVKDHSDMLSAQYLVNCLEEDQVSHGITIQEPRPRPMKETLHSRHHSTVLPWLGSNRMESLQNLHTHAVDSAIQLQGYNRVLKKRPPQISDEEQRLNRRQRCTLSQLRSGHCHLLQDYKHRVFCEPSDICTDRGASPQDVRHLFACTTPPTDLSPEDLWRNPVRSIRAFSYLDNGNLDWLEDGPGRGKQQHVSDTLKALLAAIYEKFDQWLSSLLIGNVLLLFTHSHDRCYCGEIDIPACDPPASFSAHQANSAITAAGFLHKSRGDNILGMRVQLKRSCGLCMWVLQRGIMVMYVIWRWLCVIMIWEKMFYLSELGMDAMCEAV